MSSELSSFLELLPSVPLLPALLLLLLFPLFMLLLILVELVDVDELVDGGVARSGVGSRNDNKSSGSTSPNCGTEKEVLLLTFLYNRGFVEDV